MSLHDVGVSLPLFYEPLMAEVFVPFEEWLLWYHIHPKFRLQVKDLTEYLLSNTKASDTLKECVQKNNQEFYN